MPAIQNGNAHGLYAWVPHGPPCKSKLHIHPCVPFPDTKAGATEQGGGGARRWSLPPLKFGAAPLQTTASQLYSKASTAIVSPTHKMKLL